MTVRALWGLVLLVMLAANGCCLCGPLGSSREPNVFVLRGVAGYWPGVEAFEEDLCDAGVCPTTAIPEVYPHLADRIAEERESGRLRGPLVLVGYSLGANAAIKIAQRLDERGIDVDKLVLLETTLNDEIPANVHSCFNVYKSQPSTDWIPVFRGIPLETESARTRMYNLDLRCSRQSCWKKEHHLTICANRDIHALLVEEVLDGLNGCGGRPVCPSRCR
ncbi:MAG: thioesterase domain-containing protein [Planctomycetales bacterium]